MRRAIEAEGPAAWDDIVRRYDQYSVYEFLRSRGWSDGAIEYYAVHELRGSGHAQRGGRGAARGPRRCVPGHAVHRGRHGRAAERVLRGAPGRGPPGCRGVRHRAGSRRGHGPLQDRGRPVHGARRLRGVHPAVPGAADGRGHARSSHAASSGRSASSTTTHRPRSCSRSASASGRRTTASWAARP